MIDYLENTISDEQLVEMVVDKHRFKDEGKTFHIGIIDYLQEYNTFKSFERCSKILYYWNFVRLQKRGSGWGALRLKWFRLRGFETALRDLKNY